MMVLRRSQKTWIPLKDMKKSHSVDVAEFAVASGIDKMPAFSWWVHHVLKKRDTIIASVKARVKKSTHKYGIEVPTSVEHAKLLDKKNNNHLWMDALAKDMANVGVAFKVLEHSQTTPVGWKLASGYLIWNINMDFTRKARWVKDGYKTADPLGSNYDGFFLKGKCENCFHLYYLK